MTSGEKHAAFIRLLEHSIRQGSNAEGKSRIQTQFLRTNTYEIIEIQLLATWKHLNGTFHKQMTKTKKHWIELYGGEFKAELKTLRHIRNAIEHNKRDLKKNHKTRYKESKKVSKVHSRKSLLL